MRNPDPPEITSAVVVVGAAGGIGSAVARDLAKRGYPVALADIALDKLQKLAAEIQADDGTARIYPCSVADASSLQSEFDAIDADFGGIHALINCAGVGYASFVTATDPEIWRRVIDINLTGLFHACQAVLPAMLRAKSGYIVNIISIGRKRTFDSQSAYCASKWGALAFTRVLAGEMRPQRIKVSALCLGAVDTALWNTIDASFDRTKMLRPESVARVIADLLSLPEDVYVDEMDVLPSQGIF